MITTANASNKRSIEQALFRWHHIIGGQELAYLVKKMHTAISSDLWVIMA